MSAPVTGPHERLIGSEGGIGYVRRWWSYRQRRPYNLQLAHYRNVAVTDINPLTINNGNAIHYVSGQYGYASPDAYSKAYRRFVDELGESTSLGIDLAQYRQASSMISARAGQLVGFTKALATRSPLGVARSLGIKFKTAAEVMSKRKYGRAQTLADLWLEFWFGWKPLVGDIFDACEVFEKPLASERIKVSAKHNLEWRSGGGVPAMEYTANTVARCVLGAEVSVTNPNLRLLQQLGLLNPVSVAWDAVPWSFVLGWFSNVETYLGSLTDFAGLAISNGYIVDKMEGTTSFLYRVGVGPNADWDPITVTGPYSAYVNTYWRRPLSVLPPPRLLWKKINLSNTRALTAISLLVQKLPRDERPPKSFTPIRKNRGPKYRWDDHFVQP